MHGSKNNAAARNEHRWRGTPGTRHVDNVRAFKFCQAPTSVRPEIPSVHPLKLTHDSGTFGELPLVGWTIVELELMIYEYGRMEAN